MSKVLPVAVHDRPELNLRQGIKSSLNHWRQLIAASYLFYQYVQDGGDKIYSKEINTNGKVSLGVGDAFAAWLTGKYNAIANVKVLVQTCPLYLAQIEHLQVGLQLFLKLAQVAFADVSLPDASERTGGSRYNKTLSFSTNMKIMADVISSHSENDRINFVAKWLSGNDESIIANQVKNVLASFTEECQFKIRTGSGEVFFQQDGIYECLRNPNDSVESSDASEPVGPFRILKSYVREGMHPYLEENSNGFVVKSSLNAFTSYADMVRTTLSLIPKRTTIYQEITLSTQPTMLSPQDLPLQLITYGAPGTGKSWSVKQETRGKSCIRTTFHPDSDYSTFVGAYKPSMEVDEYDTVVTTGEKIAGGTISKKDGLVRQKRIVYKFVAQAFLEAYVEAWRKCAAFLTAQDDDAKNAAVQFLVIEEINRGNCAQIFGDIFQLLDREDDGYSSYAIKSDADLRQYLKDAFERAPALDLTGVNLGDRDVTPDEIKSGEKMLLPPNMLIRATMNTSDQSLFPIDSAFKRRWDWKYVPIKDEGKGWFVSAGGKKFDWWKFLQTINEIIYSETSSADKQLGYFFIKVREGNSEITSTTFVDKVAFYLWNDVFKDCELVNDAFKLKDADGKTAGKLMFTLFFKPDSEEVDEAVVEKFLSTLLKDVPDAITSATSSGDGTGTNDAPTTED